ncbi:hypothetical protein CORT_0B04320 [Candida orthopsilosis Co 90-125]|uniref:Uncharacterized protein n=1 Tax=Candida orthopsilosis (strain 90-125) TaxID=1136231 RepID=H8X199_CANO9|nr:hypothetical protein CORT_0B04320 [Candida orthopsilosis Co 90-125]CCG22139.1 hypothetical protein CORT_0B04320 [Candida orthopsilosis Co 90-125]
MPKMRSPSNIQNESPKKQQRNCKTSTNSVTSYDYNDEPIGKVFTDKKFIDPLHGLLVKNQRLLSKIRIELPYASLNNLNQSGIKSKVDFPIFEDEQKLTSNTATSKTSREQDSPRQTKEESGDNLACHANNILRMAIDSTMMSSMNSITLQNINSESFDENGYPKESGVARIEINEEEIRAAING